MQPVLHDSGGRFDAGCLARGIRRVLPPGHYEPGALSALSDREIAHEQGRGGIVNPDPERGPGQNRDVKSAGGPQGRRPRDAGEPAFLILEWFRGVPRHPPCS